MENCRFHISEWQDLWGIEFFSQLTDPTSEIPRSIHYRGWVISDPTIVKDPVAELPGIFFAPWQMIGPKSLENFLDRTGYDLPRLYDLLTEPEYGFECEDFFVKPVSLGKRFYRTTARGPRIEVWSFHEGIPSLSLGGALERSRREGLQRMF